MCVPTYVSLKKVAYLADSENIVVIVSTYFLKKGFVFKMHSAYI